MTKGRDLTAFVDALLSGAVNALLVGAVIMFGISFGWATAILLTAAIKLL